MPYLIMIAVLALGVYFSLRGQKRDPMAQVNIWPYIKAPKPLDPLEISFFHALRQYLDDGLVVCPKMPLENVFYIPQNARLKRAMRDKLHGRCVDFAVCDQDMALVCIIDLESGGEEDNSFRASLEKIAKNASVPLFTFPSAFEYTADMFSAVNELYRSGTYL